MSEAYEEPECPGEGRCHGAMNGALIPRGKRINIVRNIMES